MEFTRELPRYDLKESVSALKIARVIPNPRGYELHFEDEGFVPIAFFVGGDFVPPMPAPGDYLVLSDVSGAGIRLAEEFEARFSPVAATIDPDPPAGISIVWHDSPESVHRAYWDAACVGEGIPYEELILGEGVGQDEAGNEVKFTYADEMEGMRLQGCWACVDRNTLTINAWADPATDRGHVLHMLAHEIGHVTGIHHPDGLQEEMRAEQFGRVAKLAFEMLPPVGNANRETEDRLMAEAERYRLDAIALSDKAATAQAIIVALLQAIGCEIYLSKENMANIINHEVCIIQAKDGSGFICRVVDVPPQAPVNAGKVVREACPLTVETGLLSPNPDQS